MLVLVSVTAITLDQSGRAETLISGAKSVASDVYAPLRGAVNGVTDPIGRFFAGALNYGALQAENRNLRSQILGLESRRESTVITARQESDLERLLAENRLPQLSSLSHVLAQVNAEGLSDFAATVTLDKGRDQGVSSGDPVVGPGGLVGSVVVAMHSSAVVRLLTDGLSRVGVRFGHGHEGTLAGVGAGRPLRLDYVSVGVPAHAGELLFSSGLEGGGFPAGIPVARITAVRTTVGATDKAIFARPLAPLGELDYVEVLQWSSSS